MSGVDTSETLGVVFSDGVVRTMSGEALYGIPVFSYSEDVDTEFGVVNRFCQHWSTHGVSAKNVQRLFAECDVRDIVAERDALRAEVERLLDALDEISSYDTGATAGLAYTAKLALKGGDA